DLTLFWAIDGGVEMIKLFIDFGVDLNARSPKDWTPLSYSRAKGKYGATEQKGIYPEDVLLYYGASEVGSGPEALGTRSPRNSFNPTDPKFARERGSYQTPYSEP
ncbi:ANK_REP_REGION domain-containing protein, partial [Haematococcus lacustris]